MPKFFKKKLIVTNSHMSKMGNNVSPFLRPVAHEICPKITILVSS